MTNPNQKPPTDVPKSIEVDDDDCKQPVSSLTIMGEPKSTPKRRKSKKKKRSSEEKSDSKKSLPSPPPLVEEPDEDESKKDDATSEKKLKEGKKKKKEKDEINRKSIHSTKSNKSSKSNKSEKKKKKKVASGDIEMAPSTTKRKSKSKIRDLSDRTLDEDFMVEDADDTPSTPKKRKSKSRKKKPNSMMQIDMDGNVQERALKNVYGNESGEPTMPSPKKKSKKKQKRISTCTDTDTSNKTLPTAITDISNHSRSMSFSQRSTHSGMEIMSNPNPYGRAPSYMRTSQRGYPSDEFRSQRGYPSDEFRNCEPLDEHSSHSYRTYNSYDNSHRDSRSFYGDEEDQMRYKKSTMDLADTTIRKPKCCLIASGIFFCVMAITITVIIAKKMPQWTGQTRRLEMFFSPHQHNFLRGMRSGAQSLDAEQHRDGSLDDLFYDDGRDDASATTSSSPGFLFPF